MSAYGRWWALLPFGGLVFLGGTVLEGLLLSALASAAACGF